MLKRQITTLAKRYGYWRLIHIASAAAAVALAGTFLLELTIPVRLNLAADTASIDMNMPTASNLSEILRPKATEFQELPHVIRPSLFKPSSALHDKPMADKTIERIRSQLKLQCIMEIKGERTAYIDVKGAGLKKCKVGDCIDDLFTVVNIDKKSIEITIIGHKVSLSL
ncbi:MAG TPA: hypothetical protein VMW16_06505 [Sedimentisphaerales bacterium]|nr:hypothetical protein [Sedimentisphaerales bacterium]